MNDEISVQGRVEDRPIEEGDRVFTKKRGISDGLSSLRVRTRKDDQDSLERIPSLVELDQQQIDTIIQAVPRGWVNVQDVYPLSPLQEGILFHHMLNEQGDSYILSTLFEVESRANLDALIKAIGTVIDRHDILRTAVLWQDLPRPLQVVCCDAHLPIEQLTTDPNRSPLEQISERLTPGRERMDLQKAPLLRLQVVPDSTGDRHYALLQVHHLACDHQSFGIVVSEVMACLDQRDHLLPRPVAFKHHVAQALADADADDAEAFFHHKLGDILESSAPFGLLNVHGDGAHVEEARCMLGSALVQRVRLQARRAGVSPARLFHAVWALVVAGTSGQDDVVFGTVLLAARQRSLRAERMLGLSVNTLPLRVRLRGVTVKQLIEQTHDELTDLLEHESTPLTLAQRCSGLAGSAPLFTSLLNYRRSGPAAEISGAAGVKVLARGEAWTNYPISLTVDDRGNEFELIAKAELRVNPKRLLGYVSTALASLLDAMEHTPEALASSLEILPEIERREVTESFNATLARYPEESTIQELFQEQVRRMPFAIAATYEENSLTYAELNQKSNQLARYLRTKGVGPDQPVAICLERSLDMVIGLLGILKAGGAFVPLDPDYPVERLTHMLKDAAPRVLVTRRDTKAQLVNSEAVTIALDADWDRIAEHDASDIDVAEIGLRSQHLAYVIYTSGSTGAPKGVMIEHKSVVSLWQGLEHIYRKVGGCHRVAVNASFNFDASVKQFIQLLSGRTIVLVPQDCRWDTEMLLRFVAEHKIDAIDCTPWQLRSWIDAGVLEEKEGHRIRLMLVGGEPIESDLWQRLSQQSETSFYNVYGPTENTVDTTFTCLNGDSGTPHIGRPMENRYAYILDRAARAVPIGVTGELCVGGAGVARGYLNRAALTAERFCSNPFTSDPEGRMYRTGDLARWRGDGTIEYLGRNDNQVKIRGFRIELGEIEARLLSHSHVREAAAIVREDAPGERRLVAYVTRSKVGALNVEALRTHLKDVLPDYMVPSAIVTLEQLPTSPSGKLDRRALPVPQFEAYAVRQYEAPRGEVEEILAEIWQGLLRIERVGRHDNFFELGGHSLLIMQMMERLRRVGLSTDVRRVFETPSLADLARFLTLGVTEQFEAPPNLIPVGCKRITPEMLPLVALESEDIERIVQSVPGGPENVQDIYPLDPLQEGILFHHLLHPQGGDTYIVSIVLSVSSKERLDELLNAFRSVIVRHDILRTAVIWEKLPQPIQVVYRQAELPVQQMVLDAGRDPIEQINEWIKPDRQRLDISRAPLMRVLTACEQTGRCYAVLQSHHMTSDHVTLETITAEVVAYLQGRANALPESLPYRTHIAQVMTDAKERNSEEFFRNKIGDIEESTAPFGLLDVHGDGSEIVEAREDMELLVSQRVRLYARRLGVSAATLFHAAWALVVARTSGRDDVVFGSVLLGRLQGSAGAQRTLGMFINTLPLRLRLQDQTAKAFLMQTQRELVELLGHEQASLAVAQRCSRVSGATPLFTSLLNYRHSTPDPDSQWSGASGIRMLAVQERTNYPITVSVDDMGEGFAITAQTDRRVDPGRILDCLQTAMRSLLKALEEDPSSLVRGLSILSSDEYRQVVEAMNATQVAYPREELIHKIFEDRVKRAPLAMAVIFEGQSFSYERLNARANQLARLLRRAGVGSNQLVGICVERSLEMIVGLLGILKAGGAYLPLDPNYPTERLQHMLEDAGPRILVTQERLVSGLPATQAEIVLLDTQFAELAEARDEDLVGAEREGTPKDLLYVIYTSGSTGRPKGIAMPHCAMANLIEWHRRSLPLVEGRRVLQFAALSFDVAFQEIFSTLCGGGTLVLLDERVRRDAGALTELLSDQAVERLFVPPMMLQALAEHCKATGVSPPGLKDVIVAGEQLRISPEIIDFFKQTEGCRLHNHYGPTETHVVTAATLEGHPDEWPALPTIGRPIANTQIYILDAQRQPVPISVTGEIFIGGANVARGYLGQAELTAQRFLRDPFHADTQSRMYRTGDLARWRADGTIEYVGRNDDQVKIRGFRIELGEVEARLALHAAVREAAVVAREDAPGMKKLVAYVTQRDGEVGVEELRTHLRATLPEHMIPTAFVILDTLPLTPSGKLDRRALPAPELGAYATHQYEAPQGEIEKGLAEIWQGLLHVERVGRNDSFFELGGHSLLVLKALFKINQAFGSALKVTDVYKSPTVQELAVCISGGPVEDDFVDLQREAVLDDAIIAKPGNCCVPEQAILLTGATGFVGRFLLSQLLHDTDATIYCLVRAPSAEQASSRLRTTLAKWELWHEAFEHRIVAIPGDLGLPRLGIDHLTYELLSKMIDSIYHCGTSMNHLETYSMAKAANVGSAQELLKLATSHRTKQINFISTLGTFSSLGVDSPRTVDETSSIDNEKHRQSSGYVASKWVGEKIFLTANERGIPCNIFRLGLVWADTQLGRYDELQRVYRTFKSCLLSGFGIENYQRYTNPLTPVDYATRAMVFLASQHRNGGGIFHISSPAHMEGGIFERCNSLAVTPLKLLPFYEWIREMKQLHFDGRSLPAVPLIEFAFSMDEAAFHAHYRRIREGIRVDCERTYRELESAGIVAPVLNDDLLRVFLARLYSHDPEVRDMLDSEGTHMAYGREHRAADVATGSSAGNAPAELRVQN